MSISTRGLLLVLVLGSLFLLALGLNVVADTVKDSAHRYQVTFRVPEGNAVVTSADNSLSALRKMFPQPKTNGLVPPPPDVTPNFYLNGNSTISGG